VITCPRTSSNAADIDPRSNYAHITLSTGKKLRCGLFNQSPSLSIVFWGRRVGAWPSQTEDANRVVGFNILKRQKNLGGIFSAIKLNYWSNNCSYFRFHCSTIIKKCVNATNEDVVVFTGSGTTSAIHKLIHALQLEERRHERHVSICHQWIWAHMWVTSMIEKFDI